MSLRGITLIVAVVVTGIAANTFISDAHAASRLSISDRLDRVKAYRADRDAIRSEIDSRLAELRSRLNHSDNDTKEKPKSDTKNNSKSDSKSDSKSSSDKEKASKPAPKEEVEEKAPAKTKSSDSAPATVSEVAKKIHDLTNAERKKHGVAPLKWDGKLANIATGHSKDMASRDYFSHSNRSGCSPSCRAKDAGYDYYAYGENIAMGSNSGDVAARFMKGWMNSSGHRKNILNANYTNEGIGVAVEDGKIYVTANFADPR